MEWSSQAERASTEKRYMTKPAVDKTVIDLACDAVGIGDQRQLLLLHLIYAKAEALRRTWSAAVNLNLSQTSHPSLLSHHTPPSLTTSLKPSSSSSPSSTHSVKSPTCTSQLYESHCAHFTIPDHLNLHTLLAADITASTTSLELPRAALAPHPPAQAAWRT